MEVVSTYFIMDNRQLGYRSFEVEAAHASYHFNMTNIINKHITMSDLHEWISYPKAILFANSPTSCNISTTRMDLDQINNLLQPKYSCIEASNISVVNETWGKYLTSGLRRIKELILDTNTARAKHYSGDSSSTIRRSAKHVVHIYSLDICLLGSIDNGGGNINSDGTGISNISKYTGVRAFFDALSDLSKCCNESLFVRIVCPVISQSQYHSQRQFSINSMNSSRSSEGHSAMQMVLAVISAAQSRDGILQQQQRRCWLF